MPKLPLFQSAFLSRQIIGGLPPNSNSREVYPSGIGWCCAGYWLSGPFPRKARPSPRTPKRFAQKNNRHSVSPTQPAWAWPPCLGGASPCPEWSPPSPGVSPPHRDILTPAPDVGPSALGVHPSAPYVSSPLPDTPIPAPLALLLGLYHLAAGL